MVASELACTRPSAQPQHPKKRPRGNTLGRLRKPMELTIVDRARVAVHNWTSIPGPGLVCGINTFVMACALYRSKLVARFIPVLGLIGGPLVFAANVAVMFGGAPRRPRPVRPSRVRMGNLPGCLPDSHGIPIDGQRAVLLSTCPEARTEWTSLGRRSCTGPRVAVREVPILVPPAPGNRPALTAGSASGGWRGRGGPRVG